MLDFLDFLEITNASPDVSFLPSPEAGKKRRVALSATEERTAAHFRQKQSTALLHTSADQAPNQNERRKRTSLQVRPFKRSTRTCSPPPFFFFGESSNERPEAAESANLLNSHLRCRRPPPPPLSEKVHQHPPTRPTNKPSPAENYFFNRSSNDLFPLIFFCSCSRPYRRASAVGGQPGT